MRSGIRILGLLMVLAVAATFGCSRNKPAPVAPAGTAVAPSEPPVSASAPAPATKRSSTYVK